jgi:hypothetical protein
MNKAKEWIATERHARGIDGNARFPLSAHTPGPWRASVGTGYVAILSGPTIDRQLAITMTCNAEGCANARLMAAAPDLLAALEACIPWLGKAIFYDLASLPVESPKEDLSKLLSMACAAVAKAGGKS